MTCPYCSKPVNGFTGFQEAEKFAKHLRVCRKNPNNITLTDGRRSVTTPIQPQDLMDALNIRADSGQ